MIEHLQEEEIQRLKKENERLREAIQSWEKYSLSAGRLQEAMRIELERLRKELRGMNV